MAITKQQIRTAEIQQHAAARDPRSRVRLVAGPGTGKSYAIQERVNWLLNGGVAPDNIYIISFTRASALDLRNRICPYCRDEGHVNAAQVSVSTLHSLALRALRAGGLLAYPANPLVMDQWELKIILDPEFSKSSGYGSGIAGTGYAPGRCEKIRSDYEAFCGTGQLLPPGHILPSPPISQVERDEYATFHAASVAFVQMQAKVPETAQKLNSYN